MNRSKLLRKELSYKDLLLDLYPNSTGAYSLRYLSSNFVDSNVVTVRRSSDNTEQGFTPTEIRDGTLESFVGSSDGRIKRIFDQSGNGNDLFNTTESQQPFIVDSGALITQNSKPAMFFNDDQYLESTATQLATTPENDMTVMSLNTAGEAIFNSALYGFSGSDDIVMYPHDDNGGPGLRLFWRDKGGNVINENDADLTDLQSLYAIIFLSDYVSAYRNGGQVDSSSLSGTSSNAWDSFTWGSFGGSQPYIGYSQELVLWDRDQENILDNIELNINDYYNVF